MSGRSTRAPVAAEAATTQLETIDVRLQRTEEMQERMAQILVEVPEFMRTAQVPGLGTAHAVGLGAAPAAAPAVAPAAPAAPPPTSDLGGLGTNAGGGLGPPPAYHGCC